MTFKGDEGAVGIQLIVPQELRERLRRHKDETGVLMMKTMQDAIDHYLTEWESGRKAKRKPSARGALR